MAYYVHVVMLKKNKLLIKWVESLVITIIFIIIGNTVHDPLSINSPFPWIWFAPVLIALRYGLWPSQISIILLLFNCLYKDLSIIYIIKFQLFVLGGFLLTLLCVAFQTTWFDKIRYSDKISTYLQKRIQTIAYGYQMLSLTYYRLEHSIISKPITLRSSLMELREMLARKSEEELGNIMNRFLNIIAEHCFCEVAAIFPAKNNKIIPQAIAAIGEVKPPKEDDHLIKDSIDNAEMSYVSADELMKGHMSDYLVAAPFFDEENEIYAFLIIQDMPFLGLNNENLETISLLLEYFNEGKTSKGASLIIKQYPNCPVDFANELQRLFNIQIDTKMDSAMIAYRFSEGPHQDDYLFRIKAEKRGIDSTWETRVDDKKYLVVLMPLTSRYGLESYRIRIEDMLANEFNIKLNGAEIKFKTSQLSSFKTPNELLQDLLENK